MHLTFVFQVYFKTCFTKCQASIRFVNIYTVSVFINKITVNLYKCNNIIGTTDTYWVQSFCRKYENTLCLPGLSATRVDSRLVGDFTTIQNTFSYLSDNMLFCLRCTAKLNSTDKHTVCIYVCTECVFNRNWTISHIIHKALAGHLLRRWTISIMFQNHAEITLQQTKLY